MDGIKEKSKIDNNVIFSMIFGNDMFLNIVGELKMATSMNIDESVSDPFKLMKLKQLKREVMLAVRLADKLSY